MARRPGARTYAALAIGVGLVVVAVVLAGPKRLGKILGALTEEPPAADACAPGLSPMLAGGCFASPPGRRRKVVDLIVYLHGRYDAETAQEEVARQTRLATLATKAGFAVLALKGKQGQCTDPAYAQWWCWPSNETNQGDGPKFVDAFTPSVKAARVKAAKAGRTLLLGFSNGAYFATLIVTRALHPFDAAVIAHGGPVQPTEAKGAKVPLLLETATEDPSNGEMQRLSQELTKAEWPHEMFTRGGVHELPVEDIDAALEFFAKTRDASDAGADAGDDFDDEDDEAGADGGVPREGGASTPKTPPAAPASTLPDVADDGGGGGCGGMLGR